MTEVTETLSGPRVDETHSEQALWLPGALTRVFPITWETAIVIVLGVVALGLRLWSLGARVMSHDESLHVYYSWLLASGKGFAHNPMMHGPFLFEATALMNLLFGASDFTSRLVPVLLGTFIAIGIPQLLKPWMGRTGSLVASVLFAISPYLLYFSRYIRHDVQVIAWTLLAVVAIFRYLTSRQEKDLTLLSIALALMFSTMEITFIYLAIIASFLTFRMLVQNRLSWQAIRSSAEFDLLVVLSTLGAFFSSSSAVLLINPVWAKLTGTAFVDLQALDSQGTEWMAGQAGLRWLILLGVFASAATLIGVWWGGRRWLKLAGIFGLVTIPLFTTFFTNPAGLASGFIGSLGYWLAQQSVERGSQPWYYYLIVFPLYEYLPLVGSLLALIYYGVRRKRMGSLTSLFVTFLLWWGVGIIFALSLAGEKMPWLSTHIVVPLILLAGWGMGKWLEGGLLWGKGFSERLSTFGRSAVLGLLAILAVLTVRTTAAVNYANYDYTTEYIDYAHGAPGVKWVLDDLAAIANHTGAGRNLKVAYDDEVSWPMSWYLRDYPKQAFYGAQPNRQALDAPVVIAGPKNWDKVEKILGDRVHRFEVIRLWWPLEDYKNLTWERIRYALVNPDMRSALWEIVWQRDYRRYAALTGQDLNPPANWPLAERMRVYVKKEVAAQMLGLSIGEARLVDLPPEVDAYAGVKRELAPAQTFFPSLNSPRGIAIGPDGSVYVADTGNSRVVRLDSHGELLATWGSRTPDGQLPPEAGTFLEPWGVAVDNKGNVYVADTWNHRIQKFSADGQFLLQWGSSGTVDEGPDRFWGPRGVAVSPDGRVYVTDTGNKRVAVFSSTGEFLFQFGTDGDGALDEPVGVVLGRDGQVYVADTWNLRVAVFDSQGQFLRSWPVQGWASDSLDNKPYITVDEQERVYLTDPEGYRVIVFSSDGKPLAVFGQYGPEQDAFGLPVGVAIGLNGSVWVSDADNHRLSLFSLWQPQE